MTTCSRCGVAGSAGEWRTINGPQGTKYVVCRSCFDQMWGDCSVTNCIACGEWCDAGIVEDDPEIPDFTPCPVCGHDMIEGKTREAAIDNYIDLLEQESLRIAGEIQRLKTIKIGTAEVERLEEK